MSYNDERHKIIFADQTSITPNENDLHIKQMWIDIYNANLNQGAVQANGNILWDCSCLGTQAIGPCSLQFRDAFSCYQNSHQQSKGSECIKEFMKMQNCFSKYPKLYRQINNSTKSNEEVELNIKQMNHPEARRYQMNIEKQNRYKR